MTKPFGEGAFVDWQDAINFATVMAAETHTRYRVYATDDPYGDRPRVWTFARQ